MFKRQLKMDLPKHQSAFLWGARQTGKSSFLKSNYPKSIYYDLLDTQACRQFLRNLPGLPSPRKGQKQATSMPAAPLAALRPLDFSLPA
ncbi:hypothetical protein [Legionella oakridgensis]|uniref:hypothetical protein n=1 Tax=Legionella oakridgensis TaxID=29423 RepID=UPI0003DE53D3|nr:hypothetical protein [Legionella oakridgensis]ETO94528.1 hypothetical protein LOR_36c03610 [Legionella oakridgensis RV-2-2007]